MEFPEFGIKEILAALVEGKGDHLEADDYEQYPGVEDGAILVNMPGYTVIVNPLNEATVQFIALDGNGNEYVRAAGRNGGWYLI